MLPAPDIICGLQLIAKWEVGQVVATHVYIAIGTQLWAWCCN